MPRKSRVAAESEDAAEEVEEKKKKPADTADEAVSLETKPKKRKAAKEPVDAADEAEAEAPADEAQNAAAAKPRKKRQAGPEDVPGKGDEESAVPPAKKKSRKEVVEDEPPTAAPAKLGAAAFRQANEIRVDTSCPDPIQSFDEALPLLGKALVGALRKQGYAAPTPIQAQAWPIVLQGRDMVAVAKTGSGKTCGFLLPALARIAERGPAPVPKKISYWVSEPARPSVLVLAPTRELAQQIAGEAEKFAPVAKARVVSIYGGVPRGDQMREMKKGCDVLIATPGRLLDLAAGDAAKEVAPVVTVAVVTYLVLDEADRMLDMGFEADIRNIVGQCAKTGKPEEGGGATGPLANSMRQTLFFTATWPKAVQSTARSLTASSAVQVRIGQGSDGDRLTANSSVKQVVTVMREDEKLQQLKDLLQKELGEGETAMVFAQQKTTCDFLMRELRRAGLNMWCRAIHSGLEQWERDEVLARFRSLTAGDGKGERGVLVCTDVASRGLDIPGVAMVVVYDFGRALNSAQNGGVESYVHRIGRTGRAGKTGRAFTFFTAEDRGAQELAKLLQDAKQPVPWQLGELAEKEDLSRWFKSGSGRGYKGRGGGKGGKGGNGGKGKGHSGKGWGRGW